MLVIAIGVAVFLFGFGLAFLAGYQANEETNIGPLSDREFDAYQTSTVYELMIASIGIGAISYGYLYEELDDDSGMIPRAALFFGGVVIAFGIGVACWSALAIQHLQMPDNQWTLLGLVVGLIGLVITICALELDDRVHAVKRDTLDPGSHINGVSGRGKRP